MSHANLSDYCCIAIETALILLAIWANLRPQSGGRK